jgi:uncharacterized membrane protein
MVHIVFEFDLLAALIAGGCLILAYHFYIDRRERRQPGYATQGLNALARMRWVEHIMRETGKDVLAVQTLRNSVMAASIMASTAILLVIGTLNMGADGARLEQMLGPLASHRDRVQSDHALILLLLLADFFVAFFMFSMAIRFYNHVGYMINLVPADSAIFPPYRVAAYLNRAGRFYSLGTRAFYMCVPLVFGLFGPAYVVVASVGLIAALSLIDRPPPVAMSPIAHAISRNEHED